jgi:hypothetical protein
MERLRRLVGSMRVTPVGWLLLVVAVVSLGLALFGSHSVQAPALIVAAAAVFVMVLGAFPGGLRGAGFRYLGSRSEPEAQALNDVDDQAAWQRERERREHDGR